MSTIGLQRVSFSEMLTILFEVANLVNERPIGVKPNSVNEFTYLCPKILFWEEVPLAYPADNGMRPQILKNDFILCRISSIHFGGNGLLLL